MGRRRRAFAGGVEYGVAYCWGYDSTTTYWEAGLAYAGGVFFAHYYVDFPILGNVFHAGHVVIVEMDWTTRPRSMVMRLSSWLIGLDGGAFYLGPRLRRIDRAATI